MQNRLSERTMEHCPCLRHPFVSIDRSKMFQDRTECSTWTKTWYHLPAPILSSLSAIYADQNHHHTVGTL